MVRHTAAPFSIGLFLVIASIDIAEATQGTLYWTTVFGADIRYSDLSAPQNHLLVSTPNIPTGIAVAPSLGLLYWSGASPAGLFRSQLDGTGVQQITSCGNCSMGDDIEIDLLGRKVYWTERGAPQFSAIKRANLDGTNIENVLGIPLTEPSALELDFTNGKIYWAEAMTGSQPGRIRRANLDGTEVQTLLNIGAYAAMLEMDFAGGKMYWTSNNEGQVWWANLDGTGAAPLLSGLSNPLGLQLDLLNQQMYWSEHFSGIIGRSNLDGSGAQTFLQVPPFRVEGLALDVVPEPGMAGCLLATCGIVCARRRRRSWMRSAGG